MLLNANTPDDDDEYDDVSNFPNDYTDIDSDDENEANDYNDIEEIDIVDNEDLDEVGGKIMMSKAFHTSIFDSDDLCLDKLFIEPLDMDSGNEIDYDIKNLFESNEEVDEIDDEIYWSDEDPNYWSDDDDNNEVYWSDEYEDQSHWIEEDGLFDLVESENDILIDLFDTLIEHKNDIIDDTDCNYESYFFDELEDNYSTDYDSDASESDAVGKIQMLKKEITKGKLNLQRSLAGKRVLDILGDNTENKVLTKPVKTEINLSQQHYYQNKNTNNMTKNKLKVKDPFPTTYKDSKVHFNKVVLEGSQYDNNYNSKVTTKQAKLHLIKNYNPEDNLIKISPQDSDVYSKYKGKSIQIFNNLKSKNIWNSHGLVVNTKLIVDKCSIDIKVLQKLNLKSYDFDEQQCIVEIPSLLGSGSDYTLINEELAIFMVF